MSVNGGTTDWQRNQGLFLVTTLFLAVLSGCGSEQQSDLVQVNSVPVSLNITMPEKVATASNPRNGFWAAVQRWLSPTEAWAANVADIVALVVEITGPGIPSPIKVTEPISGATGGQVISIVLDVPVGPDRRFIVSALNAADTRIFQGQSEALTLTAGQAVTANIQIADIAIRVTTTSLPGGTVGIAYSATVQAERVNGAVGWAIIQGQLPSGLTLNGSTGVIAGTPATVGTFNFTVRATDSSALFDDQELSMVIAAQLTITTTRLRSGTVGAGYSEPLQAAGAIGAVTWSLRASAFPPGLTLNQSTGLISGTPTTVGTSTFTVRATDTAGRTDDQNLSITITPPPTITTAELPGGLVGEVYNVTEGGSGFQLEVSGGVGPYTWSRVGGQLPPGLSLSSAGVISGTPSGCNTSASFESFSAIYRVRDSNGAFDEEELSLGIECSFSD